METKEGNKTDNESGASFQKHQSAVDKGLNERIKSEDGQEADVNENQRRNLSTDVSEKKTGGGKQKSPGD